MKRWVNVVIKTTEDNLSPRDHKRVSDFVDAMAGIQLPESKKSMIEGRLRKRQRMLGLDSLHAYIDHVLDSPEGAIEQPYLLDAITTNKTDFYREIGHFKFLHNYITDALVSSGRITTTQPFRIWSAGCSSGEEPYTLAFEMMEISQAFPDFRFEIYATDISISCLKTAATGIYPHEKIESMPLALRRKYLLRSKEKSKNLIRISPEVRQCVKFFEFNLLTGNYHFNHIYDVILCRNVMIYFSDEGRSTVIQGFHKTLAHNGLLILGHSESLANKTSIFTQLQPTIYCKADLRRAR